jgi:23S rRNA pseudouridine1911/1915/1917 synthase
LCYNISQAHELTERGAKRAHVMTALGLPGDYELTLTAAHSGDRLDRFLAGRLEDVSRAEIQRWIKDDRVSVNGRAAKSSHKVLVGDTITVWRPPGQAHPIAAEAIPLEIAYEDDEVVVINKSAGMVVHPAPGHSHGTLVNALLARDPGQGQIGGPERAGVVHRLDRDTSGLLLVAKTVAAYETLLRQFRTRRVEKTYLALVEGMIEVRTGRIEAPIGRDPKHRQRMAVVPEQRGGRRAVTAFRVMSTYGESLGNRKSAATLLELDLLTGRTHQIRVHLAFLKHPVVGDRVYGRRNQSIACPRQFLHATRLAFQHPKTGARVLVEAPLPEDLLAVLRTLI